MVVVLLPYQLVPSHQLLTSSKCFPVSLIYKLVKQTPESGSRSILVVKKLFRANVKVMNTHKTVTAFAL